MPVRRGKIILVLVFFIGTFMGPSFQQASLTQWTDFASNPVFDPGTQAYYPTVIYDANAFSGHGDGYHYKMWYDHSSSGGMSLAGSNDGVNWTIIGTLTGLQTPRHARVIYNSVGFGGGMFYQIWYRDYSPPDKLYSIQAMRYAESADGLSWSSDQPLTQNPSAQLVTGGSSGWNRGTYGPMHILFDSSAPNTGTNPFGYSYVMYFDGTTGGTEEVGLAYSTDGKYWSLYSKVLSLGSSGSWDDAYACFGTVLFYDGLWHMWYSGGSVGGMGTTGIGYATSSDGIVWAKHASNPLVSLGGYGTFGGMGNAGSWNERRNYTPMVLYDANRFSGHGQGCELKMWRSGVSASGNYAVGYASMCLPPLQPTPISPNNGEAGLCPLNNMGFDWSDSSGAESYRVQISMADDFSTNVADLSGLVTSEYTHSGTLLPMTTYFWRVRGINDAGEGNWSPTWSFKTGACFPYSILEIHPIFFSLRPLAQNQIGKAEELQAEVENLLKLALERGLDASPCEVFYEDGLKHLSHAKKFLQGNNFTPANNFAIYAENEFLKARDCLEALLG